MDGNLIVAVILTLLISVGLNCYQWSRGRGYFRSMNWYKSLWQKSAMECTRLASRSILPASAKSAKNSSRNKVNSNSNSPNSYEVTIEISESEYLPLREHLESLENQLSTSTFRIKSV